MSCHIVFVELGIANMPPLAPEEYIEQAYFFRGLNQRIKASDPIQEVIAHLKEEILATTKLPMAIDYLLSELNHVGTMSTAMRRLSHYFAAFQAFLVEMAEDDRGRFDMNQAFVILEHEALLRSKNSGRPALFFLQFETLCRNRLNYDKGLQAMSQDPWYDDVWQKWILDVRYRIGVVDITDLIYVHSEHYLQVQHRKQENYESSGVTLFGEKEGRIALANRHKEPLYLFAALQRQLGYPSIPRPKGPNVVDELVPRLKRQLEQIETRVKLLEDEQRQKGIDLTKFYQKPNS
jgi:hypothetical protein